MTSRLGLGCGIALMALGAFGGLAYLCLALTALGGAEGTAELAAFLGGFAILAAVLGLALGWAGLADGQGRPTRPFSRRAPLAFLGAFVVVLGVGEVVRSAGGPAAAVVFPVLHLLAAMLPALAIVGAAARRQSGITWRAIWRNLAYGSCVATLIALAVEVVAVIVLVAGVVAVLQASGELPPLVAALEAVADELGRGGSPDLERLAAFALHPAIIAAAILLLGIVGPLAEEAAKSAGVAADRPASAARAWLWGVTAGAGFGLTEAISQGAFGLAAWPVSMTVRAVATLMHATMTGLAGLGWHAWLVEGRTSAGVARLGLAVAGHMCWNLLVLGAALGAAAASRPASGGIEAAPGLASTALVLLFAAILAGFRQLSARYGEAAAPVADGGVALGWAVAEQAQPIEHDEDGAPLVGDDAQR